MLKVIGLVSLTWFLFHFGIAQALLIWIAAVGSMIFI